MVDAHRTEVSANVWAICAPRAIIDEVSGRANSRWRTSTCGRSSNGERAARERRSIVVAADADGRDRGDTPWRLQPAGVERCRHGGGQTAGAVGGGGPLPRAGWWGGKFFYPAPGGRRQIAGGIYPKIPPRSTRP